ncbi:hypothetical protein LTR28_010838 [Elasticomyces elasticus]|nr:hypothetical protein LTR28_010838 [Elasticomyces elasticus]
MSGPTHMPPPPVPHRYRPAVSSGIRPPCSIRVATLEYARSPAVSRTHTSTAVARVSGSNSSVYRSSQSSISSRSGMRARTGTELALGGQKDQGPFQEFRQFRNVSTGNQVYAVRSKSTRHEYVFKFTALENQEPDRAFESAILLTHLPPSPRIVKAFWGDAVLGNGPNDGVFWRFAMEYCSGGGLRDVMRRFQQRMTPIPNLLLAHVFIHISEALAHIHYGTTTDFGRRVSLPSGADFVPILHRDIKPDNIFLRWRSGAYRSAHLPHFVLGDFSLATPKTQNRGSCGTAGYFAPEVLAYIHGHPAAHALPSEYQTATAYDACGPHSTHRRHHRPCLSPHSEASDVWTLGAVVFEMATWRSAQMDMPGGGGGGGDLPSPPYSALMSLWARSCLRRRWWKRCSARELVESMVPVLRSERDRVVRGWGHGVPEWAWRD